MTHTDRPAPRIRILLPVALLLLVLPTTAAQPGPEHVRGPCLTAMDQLEARVADILAEPPGPGYIEQEAVALLDDINRVRNTCGKVPAWYEPLYCVADTEPVTLFGIQCRPIVRATEQAVFDCVFGILWGGSNSSPCTAAPHPTCIEEIEADCDTYRQTTRYVTGGWDGASHFLACPMPNTWRTVVGAGAGCNFVCPEDVCRIVVDDDLLANVPFKVCVEPCDPTRAPTYLNQATVHVGAHNLFQVYLPRYGATTGTVTATLP